MPVAYRRRSYKRGICFPGVQMADPWGRSLTERAASPTLTCDDGFRRSLLGPPPASMRAIPGARVGPLSSGQDRCHLEVVAIAYGFCLPIVGRAQEELEVIPVDEGDVDEPGPAVPHRPAGRTAHRSLVVIVVGVLALLVAGVVAVPVRSALAGNEL